MWARPAINGTFDPPSNVYVCLDLPDAQLPGARVAVEAWNESLKQWKHIIPINGNQGACTYWVHEASKPVDSDSHALAWASRIGGNEISMRKGWYEIDVTGILLHELGHAFGAQHVAGTLMNAVHQYPGRTCPDIVTVAQVAAWNHIDLDLLSWCY